jgi:ubiquinone/menaquinone biosynthesis C-methylase UbiE
MPQDQPITVFDWFSNQLTLEGRAEFVAQIGPHLKSLIQPGNRVLDLCCGAGPIAFYLEEQGALVTGIDLASALIALARQEAAKRGSQVNFIQASVFTHDLGNEVYDLVVCLGNAILDFPHQSFSQFRDKVFQALKPEGRLAIQYLDGMLRVATMSEPEEVVEQGTAGQIVRHFREYDPALGAYVAEYRHMTTGEIYEYTGYVYTGPMMRIVMEPRFEFGHSLRLSEASFLDVYLKR